MLQHELSHVMGMGHVKQWGELMQPSGGGVTDYGPGRPRRASRCWVVRRDVSSTPAAARFLAGFAEALSGRLAAVLCCTCK